jgi:ABC-2 type transport system permease protein
MLFVWKRITDDYGLIGGYSFNAFVLYYLLYSVFRNFKASDISSVFEEWVREGQLSKVLLKPVNPIVYLIVRESARVLIEFLLSLIIFIPIISLNSGFRDSLSISVETIFFVVIFSMSSFLFTSLLYLIIGTFSFWTKSIAGVENLFQQAVEILRGGWFPLDIAPVIFQKIFFILPFSYTLYAPIKILVGGIDQIDIPKGLLSIFISSSILLIILIFLWKKGLKNYEAVGN